MSRYDRGLEHPGIDQLLTQIGEARETASGRLLSDIVLVLAACRDYLARHIEVGGREPSAMGHAHGG